MTGRTAFVTGATGFIGRNLVDVLLAERWRVVAFCRPGARAAELSGLPVEVVTGDLTDPEGVGRALPAGVDCVFHVAASTSTWRLADAEQERVNVGGTRAVVEAALRRRARRVVHTSSIAAWGFPAGVISDDTPQEGASSRIGYFRTKALAEGEVRRGVARGLDAVIVSPAHVVGRYDRGNWARLITMVHQRRLPGVPPGAGSFGHGREVARTLLAAYERGRTGANYVLGGADATLLEFVRVIGEVTGRPVPRRVTPAPVLRAFGRASLWWSYLTRREPEVTPEAVAIATADLRVDSTRAERDLGFRRVPLRTAVEDAWRWLRETGLLERR